MTFNFQDTKDAYNRIKSYTVKTPLEESFYLGDDNKKYFFKLESFQKVKSFKIRGALNKMLTLNNEEKKSGVATISSGNHGSSVSYAAKLLGIRNVKIIVPESTPQSKIDKIEYFGGEAILLGKNYDEANSLGMNYILENNLTYIDAYYDDPYIYGGQGTIGIEILEQNPDIDTIVVPIGGGGLITGIAVAAKHIKPDIKIIGVQTEACPAMIKSYQHNTFYEEYPNTDTLCDSLIGGIGKLSYKLAKDYVDEFLIVSENGIAKAVSFMAKQEKFIAEAGSCTTIAAVNEYPEKISGKNIALVISGGNIDGEILTNILRNH
ncbi:MULTISPECIES: threonine ammonia-lyase [Mammaliicoccus]|jgi:threonine dehydratase|uniref:Threonine deaminase n=1 Tax=Mammaliicoccus lentus TaxID=42858 RepID=A0ABS6GT81_MAMLE|nr:MULTISPECIES: threonine/serine dehydratase [Mammaliicoccus]HBV04651.1 threonine/serine dehydratase [Staphylococcus sp.]HIS19284.1 threonine/serine dehydratase [Candidatus Coprovivens excrementavium]MBF0749718.1 threonine/serine dehydratase [Mammaliicoccus lentus]MBF0841453.1 threonine/serine dehydratase [Mammaliicoccus lentus]MBU6112572.1 threonine/serine dehydratase [Mammaliicoccus lentus]